MNSSADSSPLLWNRYTRAIDVVETRSRMIIIDNILLRSINRILNVVSRLHKTFDKLINMRRKEQNSKNDTYRYVYVEY